MHRLIVRSTQISHPAVLQVACACTVVGPTGVGWRGVRDTSAKEQAPMFQLILSGSASVRGKKKMGRQIS